jgi:4-amino-4-deoxy-L-arabinose transferase-like glycosyltransferase
MRRKYLPLFLILILGIFLRIYNINETLLFHFDQGYHGLAIKEIWENKRLALLGHKTDVEGVFHGSTFYYLMLPIYLISSWDPARVSLTLAFLDGLSIFFIFFIGKELFNRKVGLFAALLYATSYSLVSYSRWLSNVTLIPLFSTILFLFLLRAYKNNPNYFLPACFFAGLITQLNGAIGFFFLPLLFCFFYILRKKLLEKKMSLLISVIFFLIPIFPLIFFDLRHNFLVSRSIFRMFSEGGGLDFNFKSLLLSSQKLKTEIVNLFSHGLPIMALSVLILSAVAVVHSWRKKEKAFEMVKLLLFLLLVPFLGLLLYPGAIHGFFIVSLLPLFVLLVSFGLSYWLKIRVLKPVIAVITASMIIVNLYHWQGFLKPGFNLVPIGTRNLITLEDRKQAIDFIYGKTDGKPFMTLVYIIPYFQEQPWDYVFSWYGKQKYGYLPNKEMGKTFIIYEPDYDFPYRLDNWLGKIEEDHGKAIASFKVHDLIVEERER